MKYGFCLSVIAAFLMSASAYAQSAPALDAEGIAMLKAMQKTMAGDYRGAESEYSSIISANPQHVDAYLQRGVVRKLQANPQAAREDGMMAARLTNEALKKNPRDAEAYHDRGMASRLMGDYAQARRDIETAISLSGDSDWNNDLRDTLLEEKASKGVPPAGIE